jgi:hypothetical protein
MNALGEGKKIHFSEGIRRAAAKLYYKLNGLRGEKGEEVPPHPIALSPRPGIITRESVPRVPLELAVRQYRFGPGWSEWHRLRSGLAKARSYTGGAKAQAGRFHSNLSGPGFF